jgi:hypothetical protein
MDQSTLRSITNDYQQVRLVSLKGWKRADEIFPRDNAGPYVVSQEGYDPEALKMDYDEFLLGKSGEWISICVFFRLPTDLREQEFIFGTAAEVIDLMENLTGKAHIYRKGGSLAAPETDTPDELTDIFQQSKGQSTPPSG